MKRPNSKPARTAVSSTDWLERLERVVEVLADPYKWNWCDMEDRRSAADKVLGNLAREGLIEWVEHPFGGNVWRVAGRLFGRTDGITNGRFDKLKRSNMAHQPPPELQKGNL